MIFVDTGAWFAMAVPSDKDHAAIAHCFSQSKETLLTTDYVVDKTLTLLRARGYDQRALVLGAEFFSGSLAELYYLSEADVQETMASLASFLDDFSLSKEFAAPDE